jgi:hypothetical protein
MGPRALRDRGDARTHNQHSKPSDAKIDLWQQRAILAPGNFLSAYIFFGAETHLAH